MNNSITKNTSEILDTSNLSYKSYNQNKITVRDLNNGYGNIYKTTGGGNQLGGLYMKSILKTLTSNRVLDLYLKYLGIKTLTTSTLVPISLIMGKKLFEKSVNYITDNNNQEGGFNLENKIPLLDDDLIGNYLKISGLTALTLSPHTLIPLGLIMSIYSMYIQNQTGGTKLLTGASIPPNIFQKIDTLWTGEPLSHGILRPAPYVNNDLQLNTNTDIPNMAIKNLNTNVNANRIGNNSIKINNNQLNIPNSMAGGGSDWISTHNSRGAVNTPTMNINQFRKFNQSSDLISNNSLTGISDTSQFSDLSSHSTLYELNPHHSIPDGYNIGGVVSNKFST